MAIRKKTGAEAPVAPQEGRSLEERRSIRRQMAWMGALLALCGLGFFVVRWGQETGWGNPDAAVKSHFAKGEAAFVAGRFDLAASQYAYVVKHYPKHEQVNAALTQLASAYQGLGQLDPALEALDRLVANLEAAKQLGDLHAYTLLQVGKLQKDRMDYDSALGALRRVRNEHPKTDWAGEALNVIAQVQQAQRRYAEARQSFGQLIRELPGGFLAAEAQAGIGECYEAEGELRKALQSYQVVLDKYPSAVWETAKARIDALKKEVAGKSRKS